MTHPHAGLAQYRGQLRDAIERDLRHHGQSLRVGRRRALAAALPSAAAAATVALLLLSGGGPAAPSAAQAAILRHVSSALSAPSGTIVHQRALVSLNGRPAQPYELWEQTDPPYNYRVIKWGHEGIGTAVHGGPDDPAATLKALVNSGRATATPTMFDGVHAYRITVQGAPDQWVNGIAYVARSDYHPLEIESNGETIQYQTYEYLPATAANRHLLDLPAASAVK